MMERYTSQQRVEIIKIYYRNSESVASILRTLQSAHSAENIAAAEASVEESQMCLSHVVLKRWASLWRRCGEFCEMILAQELKPIDHQKRRMFGNWAEQQLENNSDFYRKIIFNDQSGLFLTELLGQ